MVDERDPCAACVALARIDRLHIGWCGALGAADDQGGDALWISRSSLPQRLVDQVLDLPAELVRGPHLGIVRHQYGLSADTIVTVIAEPSCVVEAMP